MRWYSSLNGIAWASVLTTSLAPAVRRVTTEGGALRCHQRMILRAAPHHPSRGRLAPTRSSYEDACTAPPPRAATSSPRLHTHEKARNTSVSQWWHHRGLQQRAVKSDWIRWSHTSIYCSLPLLLLDFQVYRSKSEPCGAHRSKPETFRSSPECPARCVSGRSMA
ncbi:hypothetical protein FB451DRAFT_140355 [Mycena latifolia]|nr:hypothetical protein FB451DRAFT_140355 [Mycena latifolia]